MAEYTKKTDAKGVVRYRNVTENKPVSAEDLEKNLPAVKEELDLVDEGTKVESEGMTGDTSSTTDSDGNRDDAEDDGTTSRNDTNAEETGNQESDQDNKDSEETNPYRRAVPQSEPGMGFKRKGGKTVDAFDGKTPATEVRYVGGHMVPLSKENYESKSDAEIYEQLEKLKLV